MNQQPGNNISSVFNTIFNRSLTRITLPYQEEKRKQLEHFSDYYSNLFQSVVYYNHNNFEMEVMVVQPPGNTSHQSPAQAVERPRKQVERLFLLYVALFKSAVGKGLDFIDFSRFHITKENTIVVPATFESKNNSHLRPLHPPLTYFKQYTYFKKLTAKNYEHYFDRLKKKYIFNLSQAYLFRREEFRSTILNTYTGLEQKSTINTKIRIKTSAPICKDIIKFNISSNNRGDDVLHLQIEEYPAGNIARRIAELIPKEPGAPVKPGMVPDKPGEAPPYDPNDLTKTLHQLNMYLKKSAIQTVIILIDHLKSREDAEFINYLIDSSGITGILLVVFDSPEIITYDLELNEAPTNQLEEYLI
ncbi:MAG: hypothetical protein GY757_21600, partial [bacterium]|nr:hypothetical protein [bacterium]